MTAFFVPLDVADRARQRLGVEPPLTSLDTTVDFSKAAQEMSLCFDRLREQEQRRNVWVFSIRTTALRPIDTTTMELIPAAYDAAKNYIVGSVVSYNKNIFISVDPANTANQPDISPAFWQQYFGPMTVTLRDSTTTYFAGELVYTPVSSAYGVYLSLSTGNGDDPTAIAAWSATVTYSRGQTAISSSVTYQSNVDLNLNNIPVAAWNSGTTYVIGNQVLATDGHLYTSLQNANTNHQPAAGASPTWWTDNGVAPWIAVPTEADQMQGLNWLKLDATLKSIHFLYPPNSGPVGQVGTRNVYRLPNGYLREAPQDPKAGSQSFLGAPSGRQYDDWEFQDKYIITQESRPIVLRFAAAVADVSKWDAMFCEALANRIAYETCEAITQKASLKGDLGNEYKYFMGEARTVNGIEAAPDEAPMDDYISCRV